MLAPVDDMDSIDYPGYLQDALRDMVRRVMEQVAHHGLPGEHHFFISFRTDDPEVRIPPFLRDQFPEEIRIILQNQFWDLEVDEDFFSVSLSFAATRHRLTVPFEAITEFRDPAANLLLVFDPDESGGLLPSEPEPEPVREAPRPSGPGSVIQFDPKRRK